MLNKAVALLIFYIFTFSIIGPTNMASVLSKGESHAGHTSDSRDISGHYCEIFKGPCKHGETCPNKHLHRPMKASDLHSSDNHNDKNNIDTLVIGSSCHSSDGSGVAKVIVDRFLVSFREEFYDFSFHRSLVPSGDTIYVSHIMDTPDRPPAI